MKKIFKKVSAIAASALMVGLTMGVAAAANYPMPFVSGGVADVAIVYGTGAGVSSLDLVQAGNIQANLQSYMTGSTTTSGASASGEFVKFEKSTAKLNIGDNLTDIIATSIDSDDLPVILADGTYSNADSKDFDYEQKIDISPNIEFGLFADTDYMDKDPTLGLRIAKSDPVLNYTLDFVKSAEDNTASGDDLNDFEDTSISILGKTYDITTATNTSGVTSLTLMGGSTKDTLNLNEKKTYTVGDKTYDIELTYVDSNDYCRFNVNGESTEKIVKGGTDKLSDGTYIGVADIDYTTGATTEIMRCKFYLGADKIVLEDEKEVEINDENVDNLKVYWDETNGNPFKINKMVLEWKADDDLFVTEDSSITMPGFNSIKLASGGLTTSAEPEVIKLRGHSNEDVELTVPIKSGTATIQLLGSNRTGGWTYIGGQDDGERLLTNLTANPYNLSTNGDGTQYFVATYYDGSKTGSSYLVEVSGNDDYGVDFKDVVSGSTLAENILNGTSFDIGDATFTLTNFTENSEVWLTAGTNTYVDRIITPKGLMIYLPVNSATETASPFINLSANATSYILWMKEADKDGTLANGEDINVTLKFTASTNDYNAEAVFNSSEDDVCSSLGTTSKGALEDADDDNMYICYVQSDVGTKVMYDSDPDEDTVDIYYPGEQSYGNIFLSEVSSEITEGTTTAGGQLGDILVKDSEVSSVSSKNLIVVGGSCINSVAAKLLGEPACGSDFTAKTGIGSGQFLIQSYGDAYTTGKIALLVAGYEAADTVNAATYLRNQGVDTTPGKKYKGTSSTTAELVTESA